uniref:Uncharacterized protein n=1 Tax=Anguilla anguilla TaxID=7936 RepID=A0A0E9TS20_ANGAN
MTCLHRYRGVINCAQHLLPKQNGYRMTELRSFSHSLDQASPPQVCR